MASQWKYCMSPASDSSNARSRLLLSTLLMSLTSCFSGSGTSIKTSPPPAIESAQASTYTPAVGQVVSFTASCSGTTALTYSWTFGDGNKTTGQTVTNTYSAAANYTVSVTCTDTSGQSSSTTLSTLVIVGQPQRAAVLNKRCSGDTPGTGWCWQDPLPFGRINALAEADAFVLWAVGAGGAIQQSGDGGSTWQSQNSTTKANLTSVSVVDRTTVWAGGSSNSTTGAVVQTTDGGLTWVQTGAPVGAVVALAAVDKLTSWACTSTGLYLTKDGGHAWTVQAAELGLTSCLSVSANGLSSAWATTTRDTSNGSRTANVVVATTGGINWSVVADSTSLSEPLVDLPFYVAAVRGTGSEAWLCQNSAAGPIYHYDDGKWTLISPHGDEFDFFVSSACTGIAVGRKSTQSAAGGLSSQVVLLHVNKPAGSGAPTAYSGLAFTTNGGSNWSIFPTYQDQTASYLTVVGLAAEDQNTGWITDGSIVLRTDSGPSNFVIQATSPPPAAGILDAADDLGAFAIGRGQLLLSTDGGETWSSPLGVSPQSNLLAVGTANLAWFVDGTGTLQELSPLGDPSKFVTQPFGGSFSGALLDLKFVRQPDIPGYPNYSPLCVQDCPVLWAVGAHQFFYIGGPFFEHSAASGQIQFAGLPNAASQSGVALSVADPSTAWALANEVVESTNNYTVDHLQEEVLLVHAPNANQPNVTSNQIAAPPHDSTPAPGATPCTVGGCGQASISAVPGRTDTAWISFSDGTIYRTIDGGATLLPATQPDSNNTPAASAICNDSRCGFNYVVAAVDANTAWVGSRSGSLSKSNSNSSLWYTTDGGKTWTPQSNFGVRISSINPIPEQPGAAWISGPDGILKTETAGQ